MVVHHYYQPLYLIPSPVVEWVPIMCTLGVVPPVPMPVTSVLVAVAAAAAVVEGHGLLVRGLPSRQDL